MKKVIVLIGAGSIGQAIARRVSAGKTLLVADLRQENADAAGKVLSDAGFDIVTTVIDISDRASVESLVIACLSAGEAGKCVTGYVGGGEVG